MPESQMPYVSNGDGRKMRTPRENFLGTERKIGQISGRQASGGGWEGSQQALTSEKIQTVRK